MIQVYVLVSFWDENGLHKAGTFTEVKEEDFNAYYMQKVDSGSVDAYTKEETNALLEAKQDDLTAGTNIQISDQDVISATDTGDTVSVTQVQTTGTKIATVTVNSVDTDLYAPNGGGSMDTTIIADEFDTEPVIVPTTYDQYDIVRVAGGSPWNYYWSKNDNNSDEPGQSSKWQTSSAPVAIDTWGTSIPAYGIGRTNGDVYYVNTSASSEWVNPSQGQIPSAVKEAVWKDIWSEDTESYHQYAVGDYCIYEDKLYKCTGSTTGESWDSTKWSETQVMDEIDTGAVPSLTFNTQTDVLDIADQSTAITGTLALGPVDLNLHGKTIRATIIEFDSGSMRIVYVSSDVTQLNAVDLRAVPTPGGSAWNVTDVYGCQLNHV